MNIVIYDCIQVSENKSIIDGKQFNSNEELLAYMKENNQFDSITLDLPFWKDEKYLQPHDPSDPMLFGFDWEEDDEIDDEEREKMLEDARIEAQSALNFREQLKNFHGIDLDDLRSEE